jgi:hypothetical protein
MFWWDWTGKQKLLLLATMLAVAATPWLLVGWVPAEPGAFVGGTAFLMILQVVGWLLLVGLKTGRMPMPFRQVELREESPVAFWVAAATYAALVAFAVWIIVTIAADVVVNGFE